MRRILATAALCGLTISTAAQTTWKDTLEQRVEQRLEQLDPWIHHTFTSKEKGGQGVVLLVQPGIRHENAQDLQATYSMKYDGIVLHVSDTTNTHAIDAAAKALSHEMMHVLTDYEGNDGVLYSERYDGPDAADILAYASARLRDSSYQYILDSTMTDVKRRLVDVIADGVSLALNWELYVGSNVLTDFRIRRDEHLAPRFFDQGRWAAFVKEKERARLEQHIKRIEDDIIEYNKGYATAYAKARQQANTLVDSIVVAHHVPSDADVDALFASGRTAENHAIAPSVAAYVAYVRDLTFTVHERAGWSASKAEQLLAEFEGSWLGLTLHEEYLSQFNDVRADLSKAFYHARPVEFIAFLYESMVDCVVAPDSATVWTSVQDDQSSTGLRTELSSVPLNSLRDIPLTEQDLAFFSKMRWDEQPMHAKVVTRYQIAKQLYELGASPKEVEGICAAPAIVFGEDQYDFPPTSLDVSIK